MPKIENIGQFIDTNILFDIIYKERTRHKKSIDFYRQFKNLEISVEIKVRAEANQVILKYINNFTSDLNNFLFTKDKHSTKWDLLTPLERIKRLDKFLDDYKKNKNKEEYFPFYNEMIMTLKNEIIDSTLYEIKEALIELPISHLQFFKVKIDSYFNFISPAFDVENNTIVLFNEKLKTKFKNKYFLNNQSFDMEIVINIFNLIILGSDSDIKFDFINFYTNDNKFITNYKNIKLNPPDLEETELNNLLSDKINLIKFINPY